MNGSNRHLRLRASEAFHRSPSRRVFCRPCCCVCLNRPCVGHNNNQALCGHHSNPRAGHRTLQAFYHQPPFWQEVAETWGGDALHIQRDGEEANGSGLGGKEDAPLHPCSDLPCSGRREAVPLGGHPAGSCQDRHASGDDSIS